MGDGSWGQLRIPKPAELRRHFADVSASFHLTLRRLEGEQLSHMAIDETGKILDVVRTAKSQGTP